MFNLDLGEGLQIQSPAAVAGEGAGRLLPPSDRLWRTLRSVAWFFKLHEGVSAAFSYIDEPFGAYQFLFSSHMKTL